MDKYAPKHCPNCGSTNLHNMPLEPKNEWEELYDTYCRDCEWSGDISPDRKTERRRNRKPTLEELKFFEKLRAIEKEVERGEFVPYEEVIEEFSPVKKLKVADVSQSKPCKTSKRSSVHSKSTNPSSNVSTK